MFGDTTGIYEAWFLQMTPLLGLCQLHLYSRSCGYHFHFTTFDTENPHERFIHAVIATWS